MYFFSMQNYHWISEKQQPILRTKIPKLRKCKNIEIYEADSIERYNRYFGFETLHPLVSIVHFDDKVNQPTHYMHFGFYAPFLKNTTGCKINYGKTAYDFDNETVVSFAPGQTVGVHRLEDGPAPIATDYNILSTSSQNL